MENKEDFSKRIWDGGESDNVPQVNATIELAWQAKRLADLQERGTETPVEHAERLIAEERNRHKRLQE